MATGLRAPRGHLRLQGDGGGGRAVRLPQGIISGWRDPRSSGFRVTVL